MNESRLSQQVKESKPASLVAMVSVAMLFTVLLGTRSVRGADSEAAEQPGYSSVRPPVPGPAYESEMAGEMSEFSGEPEYFGWDGPMTADCGFGCPPTWRVRPEIIYYNREGETGVSRSSAIRLGDFDYEKSGRITLGRKYDCTLGWELVYMGPVEWEQTATAVGAGTLNSNFAPSGVNISAFNGANLHQQSYRSELQNFEASQKWWGWDVITTSVGVRYVNVDEDFVLNSIDANADVGTFSIETNNHLVGPQLGIDLLFPIGNFSFDNTFKGGVFANWGDSRTTLTNAGVVQFNNSVEDIEFAAVLEGAYYLRYAITPRIVARAGYEFLWIYGLGLAPDQVSGPLIVTSGNSFDGQGDTFYHGFSAGVEIVF